MISYPEPAEVTSDLGDKVVEAFSRAVARARADLAEYRELKPDWVSQASVRGLANWIHDRMWYHLSVLLDGLPNVTLHDKEPTRDIFVGYRYRLRAKRHGENAKISTYPTDAAIAFLFQEPRQEPLTGLEEIRLIVGYSWDTDSREMGAAVLSLRDGKDNVIWEHELPEVGTGSTAAPVTPLPTEPGPAAPVIELVSDADQADQGDQTAEGDES